MQEERFKQSWDPKGLLKTIDKKIVKYVENVFSVGVLKSSCGGLLLVILYSLQEGLVCLAQVW